METKTKKQIKKIVLISLVVSLCEPGLTRGHSEIRETSSQIRRLKSEIRRNRSKTRGACRKSTGDAETCR